MGNTYRASLSLRLNLSRFADRLGAPSCHLLSEAAPTEPAGAGWAGGQADSAAQGEPVGWRERRSRRETLVSVFLSVSPTQPASSLYRLKPFRVDLSGEHVCPADRKSCTLEKTIEFRLTIGEFSRQAQLAVNEANPGQQQQRRRQLGEEESVSVEVSSAPGEPPIAALLSRLEVLVCSA